jgi:hypothetical protein
MKIWEEESTEVATLKKLLPEYISGWAYTFIAIGYLILFRNTISLVTFVKVIGLYFGAAYLTIGLFGLSLKRAGFKSLVFRGEKGRVISASYFVIGFLICIVILLVF